MITRFGTFTRTALVAALVTVLAAPVVQAKPGGGRSSGSRGGSTYSPPPATATAPGGAAPVQRSATPNVGQPARPGMAAPAQPAKPRFGGLGTAIMGGLLGAGLFGLLSGSGLFGGLSGLTSMLGLLFQIALIAGAVWLVLRFFRRRQEPAMAGAGAAAGGPTGYARSPLQGGFGGGGGGAPQRQAVEIGPDDYKAFERNLGEIQISYGRGDVGAIRRLSTPEMASYFEQDLAEDRSRGIRNEVSEPKLLQGDLAEAWREGTTDYATVAMRFEIIDAYVEVASGKVVEGDRTKPQQAVEIWTFRRDMRGPWVLSAIQQAA